ncbi:3-hydroxyacyl-CoA dehydrogenase [Pantoea sp. 18069]|uniref:3-hydroxyacyl-CoA dehydrogenase n=1 Tax=Pantoea sp. 18069 TaxID=2681415 RepID=UPI00135A330C|nr:3-hydroxyacyl-CoA dehydrogenase [Pantoea sp. 18069]
MSHFKNVAIAGGGSIGVAFALQFARAGKAVRIFEQSPERCALIPGEIGARLEMLGAAGLLEGEAGVVAARIQVTPELHSAVADCHLVVECVPEIVDIKRELFAQLERHVGPDVPLCSASSALPVSRFCSELATRQRCLIAHPGNPPYLIPVVELVPAPFTDAAVVARCTSYFQEVGMSPVLVKHEVEGFVFNRLQGALLREAYCLVRDGVASVEDVDKVVRDGLGLRWSVIGPFETVDLNTRGGIAAHAQKMGPAYQRMGQERGQNDPWTDALVQDVAAQRRAVLPLDQWEARVEWRDRQLMQLAKMRKARAANDDAGTSG